jgi:hypothetical protein
MVDDHAALEAHDHPPGPKRDGRQLHRVQVEDLDVLTGDRWIADLDDRDLLRDSDGRSGSAVGNLNPPRTWKWGTPPTGSVEILSLVALSTGWR